MSEDNQKDRLLLLTISTVAIVGIVAIFFGFMGVQKNSMTNPLSLTDEDLAGQAGAAVSPQICSGLQRAIGTIDTVLNTRCNCNGCPKRGYSQAQCTADRGLLNDNLKSYERCYNGCIPGQVIGDVNGDGKVTKFDSILLNSMSLGKFPKPENICCADVDTNGEITSVDATSAGQIASGTLQSPGKCPELPNLVVTDVKYSNLGKSRWDDGIERGTVNIIGTIKNIGNAPTTPGLIVSVRGPGTYAASNGNIVRNLAVNSYDKILQPNEAVDVQISGAYIFPVNTAINEDFTVFVDMDAVAPQFNNRIKESNENDNSLTKKLQFRVEEGTPVPTITLQSAQISGNSLILTYNKNFDGCAQLVSYKPGQPSDRITHDMNLFCLMALTTYVGLNKFSPAIRDGDMIKICKSDNLNICSASVQVRDTSQLQIHSINIVGSNLEVYHSKNFNDCARGFVETGDLLSLPGTLPIVCEPGDNKKSSVPISMLFTRVYPGEKIKFCYGLNNEKCTDYVRIPGCTDLDGGKNFNVKGTTFGASYAYMDHDSLVDYCSSRSGGNYVAELYCENGWRWQMLSLCPNGCRDGACV